MVDLMIWIAILFRVSVLVGVICFWLLLLAIMAWLAFG
jgi:hypothetical protein